MMQSARPAAFFLLLALCLTGTGLVAQTFPTPGFTLPNGKTICITYEVDVNANVCPAGTMPTDITNQATVSGSNFATVLTDDPSNPAPNPSPTLTPVSSLTLGNLVYKDVNNNGTFDGGDLGVNGVLLRLYADDGDGTLDAGDGAAIATATTAGGGLYTFVNLCPGDYIVEVAPSNFNVGGPLYDNGLMGALISSPVGGAPDPDNDVNNDDNGDPVAGFGVASQAITLALGTEPTNDGDADVNTNLSLDFGFKNPTTITINDVTMAEGTGGSTTAFTFTVTRSIPDEAFSLTVNTANGTATTADLDYQAISGGTVSFTANGPLTQTVTVLVNHDNKVETNETFTVVLSGAPAGIIISDGTGQGTITNDDNATVTLSGPASQLEGDAGTSSYVFTLTLDNPVQGGFMIMANLTTGTATFVDGDFNGPSVGFTFTGTAGETKTLTATINGDLKVELNETFTVTLDPPTGAPPGVGIAGTPATGTITNDDQGLVTISNVSVNEGNAGMTAFNFTVTLNRVVDAAVTMNYTTMDGSATLANNDYNTASGTVTFAANSAANSTQTITVQVNGDMTFEGNETFIVRLSNLLASGRNVVFSPGAGSTLDGTGTILNDDIPPVIINELDADQTGADAAEFVELYDGGVGNTNLNGLVLVFYNGSNDLSYRAIDLDGFTTNANGYFIAGNSGVPGVDAIFPNDILQNGEDAVALYTANATDFPTNTPVTTTNLIDALVYDTADPDDPGLLVLLNAGQPQVDENGGGSGICHSVQRIPNGSGGVRNTSTYQALPPTPDAANFVPIVSITVSPASTPEDGVPNLTYTVTRTGATTCDLSVPFTVTGTATSGTDYAALVSPVTIPAGSTSTTIVVNPTTDNVVEPNETVIVTLTDGAAYDLGTGAATGTIENDDAATVTLSGGASQNEGNAGQTAYTFTATLNNPVQGGFTVPYTTNDITAIAPGDYTDNDGTLTFTGTAGETKTITVQVNGDITVELDETFTVALGAISGAPAGVTTAGSPQTGTILNDDAATVSLQANVSQAENLTPQVFTVTLSNPVDVAVTILFNTSDGTATIADNDYNAVTNQTVTFAANTTTSQTVNATIVNDNKVEANEVYNVALSSLNASGRNVATGTTTGTGTIVNDDAATVTLTPAGGISQNEGNGSNTNFVFTATLNNPVQGGFTVPYTTNDGTAAAPGDYTDNDGTLTFAGTAGESQQITVVVIGDFFVEPNETFTVNLNSINGAPAGVTIAGSPQTGTILNDEVDYGDAPDSYATLLASNGARHNTVFGFRLGATIDGDPDGQPTGTANGDDTDAEGDDEDGVTLPGVLVTGTNASITVNASLAGKLDAWVDFNNNGSFADAGEKIFNNTALVAGNNTLTFAVPAGATVSTTFARFRLSTLGGLSFNGAATDGEVEDYQIGIVNNQFSINNPTVLEGNGGTTSLIFTISRTTNANASSVDYAITGGTATSGSDYQPLAAGTINFPMGGALTQNVTVTVNGDLIVEDNETVIITLSNPVNGGISSGTGTGTITNDDNATLTLAGGQSLNETNAGTVAHTFTVTLSAAVQGGFTVPYTTNDGTATAPSDYTDNDGTLTFTGTIGETQTITVQANGDITVELNETFTENLGAIGGTSAVQAAAITVSGSPQTGTILNDDAATVALAGNVSQAENLTPQVFTVTLSNPVDVPVTILFNTSDGTATIADNDYSSVTNQTVTFAANTTTSQTVNVTIVNDNKVENNEVYNVALTGLNASGRNVGTGTTTGTGTIVNDDAATVTLTPAGGISQNEGNTGQTLYQFFATLNNPVQGSFTVTYSANDGTAIGGIAGSGNDYIDNDGTVSFSGAAGQSQPISILVNGDFLVEPNETFTVSLNTVIGAPAGVTIAGSPQTGTILNDEVDYGDAPDPTYPTLLASNGARHNTVFGFRLGAAIDGDPNGQPNATGTGDDTDAEGDDEDGVTLPNPLVTNTTANVTVNASATGRLDGWVDFNNNGSWADAGEKVFNNVLLAAGNNSLSFAVPNGATPSLTFARFRLSTVGGLSFDGAATDGEVEDYQIQIVNTQFSINDPTVTEGNAGTANLTFTITRSNNASNASVNYAITGGTATVADLDYQALAAGTASFTAGGALTQNVTVLVNGDVKVELNETVEMTLSNPVNGSILDGMGTGTIVNDDAAVITLNAPSVAEGDVPNTSTLTFTITMSNPSDANVSVNYTTLDGTATIANNDYVTTSGTHTFTPGQTSKTVAVTVNGDCAIEANETLLLRLSALVNNGRAITLSGGGSTLDGTGTITNDDALPVMSCPANVTFNAAGGVCNATVTIPLPTTSSLCGTSVLEFRYRTVDAALNPTGPYNAFAPSGSNSVNFIVGRYQVEWRVTDGSGTVSCSFFLRVVDNQAPTVTCKNATVNLGASGTIVIPASTVQQSAADNCGIATATVTPNTFTCANIGPNTVVLTVTDVNGNTSTCVAVVTIKDATAPTALCKVNPMVFLDANGQVTITPATVDNGSADACGLAMMTISNNQFSCADIASPKTVTLYLKDVNNNTSQCNSSVVIKDAIAPTAVCEDVTVTLSANGKTTIYPNLLADGSTDNCSVTQYSPTAKVYTCANLGTNLLTITVKDYSNNSATCVSTITVLPPPGGCSSLVPGGPGNTMVNKPVGFAPALTMIVYPNPTDRDVTVAFELPVDQAYHLRIFDLTGRMVLQMKGEGRSGENVLPIGLGDWPAGLYIIDLEAGVLNEQKRLVIQR